MFSGAIVYLSWSYTKVTDSNILGGTLSTQRIIGRILSLGILAVLAVPSNTLAEVTTGKKWALITLDLGLGMAAAVAIVNHNKAVDEYDLLLAKIDNTTDTNFLILQSKAQDIDAKERAAKIFGIGAGLAIGYTFLDAILFHQFFPENVSLNIDPLGTAVAMKVRF